MRKTKDLLMDAAETAIRKHGYNAVSFRDLAETLGIKSASVHYHFPKKEDLGIALVDRYHQQFFNALEVAARHATTPEARVKAICDTYEQAQKGSDAICLCGVLGAESASLPATLSAKVARFFEANLAWLTDALPPSLSKEARAAKAVAILSTLEGAMMLATALARPSIMEQAARDIQAQFASEK